MIDTDKYEGHKTAPWRWFGNILLVDADNYGLPLFELNGEPTELDRPDKQLITDAPLILEGYKRWKKEYDKVRGWFLDIDNYMMEHHYDMWQEIRIEIGLDEGDE